MGGQRKRGLAWWSGPSKIKGGNWVLTQDNCNPNTNFISFLPRGYQCVPYPPQQAAEEGISASLTDEETEAQRGQDLLRRYI